jgi:hypothetical protein
MTYSFCKIVYAGQGAGFSCNALRQRSVLIETAKNWFAIKTLPLWAEHAQCCQHLSYEAAGSQWRKEPVATKTLLRWAVDNNKA